MAAGRYNKTITVFKQVYEPDEYGSMVRKDDIQYKCRAQVDYAGGSKSVENGETTVPYQKTFHVYRHNKIKDFDELEYDGNRYRILSVEDVPEWNKLIIQTELINT